MIEKLRYDGVIKKILKAAILIHSQYYSHTLRYYEEF